jgi:hypothetical protein
MVIGIVLVSMVSGSGPPRTPVSSASIAAISSGDSSKSKTSKFSAIRLARTDFGMAEKPCWRCQRRMTWAGVLPYLEASATIVGSSSGFFGLSASAAL